MNLGRGKLEGIGTTSSSLGRLEEGSRILKVVAIVVTCGKLFITYLLCFLPFLLSDSGHSFLRNFETRADLTCSACFLFTHFTQPGVDPKC